MVDETDGGRFASPVVGGGLGSAGNSSNAASYDSSCSTDSSRKSSNSSTYNAESSFAKMK